LFCCQNLCVWMLPCVKMPELFLRVFLVLADWGMVAIARLDSDIIPIVLADQGFRELLSVLLLSIAFECCG